MHLKSDFKKFFNYRFILGSGISIIIIAVFFIASSFTKPSDRATVSKEINLVIRQLGHQLLLQAGDSTSRVLPVYEMREGTFQLGFEKEFVFNHDSLMALSKRLLTKSEFSNGFTVTVHECKKAEIVYGFQVNHTSPDILACSGRIQPQGCYTIEIAFRDLYKPTFDYSTVSLIGSGILVLFSVALLIGRFGKDQRQTLVPAGGEDSVLVSEPVDNLPSLGKFLFDVKGQRLVSGEEEVNLTDKECRILELLSDNFGDLVTRETLMEKIWINEGVITGRSLDMFVSKLRKKLSADPALRITNVHGKGYKLETTQPER